MLYVTARHMEGGSGHEHIASVQWQDTSNGQQGYSSRAQMVQFIEDGHQAWVQGSPDARVGVVNATPKYIRTYSDGQWTNNLLALPTY